LKLWGVELLDFRTWEVFKRSASIGDSKSASNPDFDRGHATAMEADVTSYAERQSTKGFVMVFELGREGASLGALGSIKAIKPVSHLLCNSVCSEAS
jgi:hypothetical protein